MALSLRHQFTGRQSSKGRFLSRAIMASKGEIAEALAAAVAFAAAASGLTIAGLDQATIATVIRVSVTAAAMILAISKSPFSDEISEGGTDGSGW
jgi:hypothetical protein